jgi:ABC-type branched-subunit amino acid transport system substrate-binding protein
MPGWRVRARVTSCVLLAAVCGACALAACGSSTPKSSGVTSASGSTSASSGSGGGAPIKVMAIESVGSPIENNPEPSIGAKAAAAAINKAGGVSGHQIQVIFCNSQSIEAESEDCARKAVSEHVDAVVGQLDIFSPVSLPIQSAAGIPNVGIISSGYPVELNDPDSFPIVTNTFGDDFAAPVVAKQLGKSFAVAVADTPSAVVQAEALEKIAKNLGVRYAGTVEVPDTGVTDYSAYAAKLNGANAQSVLLLLSPAAAIGVLKSAASVGYKPQWLSPAAFGENNASQVDGLASGMMITEPFPSINSTNVPIIKQYLQQTQAIGDNMQVTAKTTNQDYAAGIDGWLSVYGLADAAKKISGPITAASLKQELEHIGSVQLPGGFKWDPGSGGPKPYPRVSNWTTYVVKLNASGEMIATSLKPIDTASVAVAIPNS